MDLREKKTKRSVCNAFLQLRSKKPLEKITVKELCELAEISKGTFYLHYMDLYDLSEQMQNDLIQNILGALQSSGIAEHSSDLTMQLFCAFRAYQTSIDILFSGAQAALLPEKIEKELKNYLFQRDPNKKGDIRWNILLSYQILGGYYAFTQNRAAFGDEVVIDVIREIQTHISALR